MASSHPNALGHGASASVGGASVPKCLGLGPTGEAFWQAPDGMTYSVLHGQTLTLSDGSILGNPGSPLAFSTATVWSPMRSASYADALVAPELPVEKREMPVVGYRGWKWTSKFRLGVGQRGFLGSMGVSGGWSKATETATCLAGSAAMLSYAWPTSRSKHVSPDQNCGCGLYVIASMDELETHFTLSDDMIMGAVVGWGKVIQHGREGWRAQHCRILALLDCKYSEAQFKNTRQAAKEYSLPVLERAGLERYVAEWGDPFAEPEAK